MGLFHRNNKVNNKGFTLVELLTAMGILGIVSLAVFTVMGNSSRTYTRTSTEATLQAEAQLVANSISDMIIDCDVNIDYLPAFTSDVDNPGLVEDNFSSIPSGDRTKMGDTSDNSVLQIINSDKRYMLLLNRDDKKIYYYESALKTDGTFEFEKYTAASGQVLAEHVVDFKVNKDRYDVDHIIWFELTYEKNNKEIKGTYQVNIRNHITLNEQNKVIKDKSVKLKSFTVLPPVTYLNVVNGAVYSTDSVYEYVNDKWSIKSGAVTVDNIRYRISGKVPSNATIDVDSLAWEIVPQNASKATGASFEKDENDVELSKKIEEPVVVLDSDVKNYQNEYYNVVATAQDGIQSAAVVYVRKVNGVTLGVSSGLTPGEGENANSMYVKKGGSVILEAAAYGWNLDTSHQYVSWKVEYRDKDDADFTQIYSENHYLSSKASDYASVTPNYKNISIVLKDKATYEGKFRITATSRFDPSYYNVYEFDVAGQQDDDGNKIFARGITIDLAAYFLKFGYGHWEPVTEVRSVEVEQASPWDANSADAFGISNDYYMYMSNLPENMHYYGNNGLLDFYHGISFTVKGDITSKNYGGDNATLYFLPVTMYRTNASLLKQIHQFNADNEITNIEINEDRSDIKIYLDYDKHLDTSGGADILKNMAKLENTIVLSKGNSAALDFYLQGYNVTKQDLIGVYTDPTSTDRGNKIAGTSDGIVGNRYITAALTSSLGSSSKLVDYGVVTIRAFSENREKRYSPDPITVRLCLEGYYKLNKSGTTMPEQESYTDYKVYLANVEKQNIYVIPPDSKEWVNKGLDPTEKITKDIGIGSGGSKINVSVYRKKSGNKYVDPVYMEYNNNTYVYNATYHYWHEL